MSEAPASASSPKPQTEAEGTPTAPPTDATTAAALDVTAQATLAQAETSTPADQPVQQNPSDQSAQQASSDQQAQQVPTDQLQATAEQLQTPADQLAQHASAEQLAQAAEHFDPAAAAQFDQAQAAPDQFDQAQATAEQFDQTQTATEQFDQAQQTADQLHQAQQSAEQLHQTQQAAEHLHQAQQTADQLHQTAEQLHHAQSADLHQAQAGADQLHQAQAADQLHQAWDPNSAQYQHYYAGQYAGAEYNVNGVMQLPADHTYVPGAEDYNGVAATLSNWAEASAAAEQNGGLSQLVPQATNGNELSLADPNVANGEVSGVSAVEKPKKLVLACHFCRGRKLRCDGGRPTCGHCAKRSLTCTYDEQVRRRGPGKRTKEMRERAAREAEAAGLGLHPESLAHLAGATDLTAATLGEPPKKAGRKRKSEATDESDKKPRVDEDVIAAAAAAAANSFSHDQMPHSLEHSLTDGSLIDPALTGEALDLPPLEPGTLGQVIQQLHNGGAQQ